MVVVARHEHDLAPGERLGEILEQPPGGRKRLARRAVAELERVAEQHQAIDPVERLDQRPANLCAAQQIGTCAAAQVEI